MWIGDYFVHNTAKTLKVGDWWYRVGRLGDETIVAERWQGGEYSFQGRTALEAVPAEKIPVEVLQLMQDTSRTEQEAFQARMEREFGQPR